MAQKILLIKTSSMGDIIHALPVVHDMLAHDSELQIDWLVEESFERIPNLCSGLRQVIPVAMRRWRKHWFSHQTQQEIQRIRAQMAGQSYDMTIDLQGLIKSAYLGYWATGATRVGYDWSSARESLASLTYHKKYAVIRQCHAIERNRRLVGLALGYEPTGEPQTTLKHVEPRLLSLPQNPFVVLIHGTSQESKCWPVSHWVALGKTLNQAGWSVCLPAGSPQEQDRSQHIARELTNALVWPPSELDQIYGAIAQAAGVVGVDTGLVHLANTLPLPVVAIHTLTDPHKTGVYGNSSGVNLGGNNTIPTVSEVWSVLEPMLCKSR
jgi:heptosyltransferase-1